MNKIIYVKTSNERSREFSIITKIVKDDSGVKSVIKAAAYDEAKTHVSKMLDLYKKLTNVYETEDIEINKCYKIDDASMGFEFIDADSLESQIDELLLRNNIEDAKREIINHGNLIKKLHSSIKFHKTDEFARIFGDVESFDNSNSGTINDIDFILGNILINNSKRVLIDYEWTFEFPIPVEYIIFRAVHYYIESDSKRKIIDKYEIFKELDISKEQIVECEQMEKHYQDYIMGNHVSLGMMRRDILCDSVDVRAYIAPIVNSRKIKIYIDKGNGLSEKESSVYIAENSNNTLNFECVLDEDIYGIRFDTGELPCILLVNDFSYDGEDVLEESDLYTNADCVIDRIFIFTKPDPYIGYNAEISEKSKIRFCYNIITKKEETEAFDGIINGITEKIDITQKRVEEEIQKNNTIIKEFTAEIQQNNTIIKEFTAEIQKNNLTIRELEEEKTRLNQHIELMENSLSWKCTKPFRKILSLIRRTNNNDYL